MHPAGGFLLNAPHMVVFPALAITIAVLTFNLLANAWRDCLDPRTRAQLEVAHRAR